MALKHSRPERGFALILAILALMLLTFLGLTLATATSTELQLATNFRWSQQALYNAEAGIEAGKLVLADIPDNWRTLLPPARAAGSTALPAPRRAVRDYEYADCDARHGVGRGMVLDDRNAGALRNGQSPGGPYENVARFRGFALRGGFTLWARRDALASAGGALIDDSSDELLILTSEGTAPTPAGMLGPAGAAVRVVQVKLVRQKAGGGACEAAEGQLGTTSAGANFAACATLTSALGAADRGVR